MNLAVFKLEDYLGEREFSTEIMFSGSDVESTSMSDIVAKASPEMRRIWSDLRLHYTEPLGHPLLLAELGKIYGFAVPSQTICTFAGAEEGIYCAMRVLLEPKDHVIIVSPCYQSLAEVAKSICETTEVSLSFDAPHCSLDVEKVVHAFKPNTKLLVINFPHNPTGAMLSLEQQSYLIQEARRRNIYVFSDEVYRGLEHKSSDQLPQVASVYDKGLSLGVMSKAYGLPGLRIGWLASQDTKLMKRIAQYKHYLSICNSGPSEVLAIMALQNQESILRQNLALVGKNLARVRQYFQDSPHFEWFEPKGGCVAFPRLSGTQSSTEFCEKLRLASGVLLLPGEVFSSSLSAHLRVGYGRANMPEALKRLKDFLQ